MWEDLRSMSATPHNRGINFISFFVGNVGKLFMRLTEFNEGSKDLGNGEQRFFL